MVVFIRREGFNVKGVHTFFKLGSQVIIDQPMSFHPREAGKNLAYNLYFEMSFAAWIVPAMSFVPRGIVDNFHMGRRKRIHEFLPDPILICERIHRLPSRFAKIQ